MRHSVYVVTDNSDVYVFLDDSFITVYSKSTMDADYLVSDPEAEAKGLARSLVSNYIDTEDDGMDIKDLSLSAVDRESLPVNYCGLDIKAYLVETGKILPNIVNTIYSLDDGNLSVQVDDVFINSEAIVSFHLVDPDYEGDVPQITLPLTVFLSNLTLDKAKTLSAIHDAMPELDLEVGAPR